MITEHINRFLTLKMLHYRLGVVYVFNPSTREVDSGEYL